MKNLAITVFVILLVVVLGLYLIAFEVRQTEYCLVTRFGKPIRQITTPGLNFKLPDPIDQKVKFDSRMRILEAEARETTTKEAIPIIVTTYVVWRVAEPLDFYNAVGTVEEAEKKLKSQISDAQNRVIGRHSFSEFINSDPELIKFCDIQNEMLTELKSDVRDKYGVEIKTLGIKQLKISKDVSKSVFERMQAERNGKTQTTVAEGMAQAIKIRTDADSKKIELLATAEARAKAIKGMGDAEAAKYYQMLDKDRELAMFLRDIEALKKTLEKRTTVILPADSEPFRLLKEMPDLKPEESVK